VAAIFGCFALFLLLVYFAYLPHRAPAPSTVAAEGAPDDLAWKATHDTRRAVLLELQTKQQTQAKNYAWVDQPKGVVQLPLDRAMELTVQEINARAKK
jgi:hypothetical protein